MLGHAFDDQAPHTRPLEAGATVFSTNVACKCCQKSKEIIANQWKTMKLLELERSIGGVYGSSARVSGVNNQTNVLSCSQCARIILGPPWTSGGRGNAYGDPIDRIQRFATDSTHYHDITLIIKKHNYIAFGILT